MAEVRDSSVSLSLYIGGDTAAPVADRALNALVDGLLRFRGVRLALPPKNSMVLKVSWIPEEGVGNVCVQDAALPAVLLYLLNWLGQHDQVSTVVELQQGGNTISASVPAHLSYDARAFRIDQLWSEMLLFTERC